MVENVLPTEVWQAVSGDPLAQIVDVRTDAEWTFVGLPDLATASRSCRSPGRSSRPCRSTRGSWTRCARPA